MGKSARSRREPYVKPVTRIALPEVNVKGRVILIVALLMAAAIAIGYGLLSVLNQQPGWGEVETASDRPNCSTDFVFNYDFSASGSSATADRKRLTALYTEATENAYRIFSSSLSEEALYNVCHVNRHPNEAVQVEGTLYAAFELVQQYGSRNLYLAPVYAEYDRIFLCGSDGEASRYDPAQNEQLMPYITELAAFANDPDMIDLKLLGGNRVMLEVSDEYLAFAEEYEIDTFLEFGWMKNAFIIDYMAGLLTDAGYTNGYLASYDGFTRNLDERGNSYSLNLADRLGDEIHMPAAMSYSRPTAIVYLRNYPMSERDRWHCYAFENGRIVTAMIDPADGVSKSATDNIVSYSGSAGCGEILMQVLPAYLADSFSPELLNRLTEREICSIWFEGAVLCHNDREISLQWLESDTEYSARYAGT